MICQRDSYYAQPIMELVAIEVRVLANFKNLSFLN